MAKITTRNYIFSLSILLTIFSCINNNSDISINTNKVQDTIAVDNTIYYSKIDSFVDLYDRKEDISFYDKKLPYPIEDSLCFYLSRLDKKELLKDDDFKYIAGKLLEKVYLEARKEGYGAETFPVYNASLLYLGNRSYGFALKIVIGETFNIDSVFDVYAHPWREFLCIDSVIVTLDKIPQMQNDLNHIKCMELVRNDKTGGCKW